ncbi:TraB/GumN family protein [Entomospira entomophila]|uniref:TraB/GumN family protein n=1 Tax=Entomospira entomophila TaxID=2719988 RepID=A0A968KQS1_9SPIO|nr:TraB/GumN family protein [Entomospira entomophilus]NIZ40079.1 TraB/GumN family protein [Entomospira entomophilus]WDI35640.1 TraB/GumN family protein [Entomospira entomophilus]
MIKSLHWYLRASLLCYLLISVSGARILPKPRAKKDDSPMLFFQATNDHHTIYLFGSIHGMFQAHAGYPLPTRILEKLYQSDLLIYDAPLSPEDEALFQRTSRSTLEWNEIIDFQQIQFLEALIDSLELPEESKQTLRSYHPWLLLQIFYQLIVAESGYMSTEERDVFIEHAKEHRITMKPLHLAPIESDFIAYISSKYGAILYTWVHTQLQFIEAKVNLPEALQKAWMRGDVETVLDLLVVSRNPSFSELKDDELHLYQRINHEILSAIQENPDAKTIFITLDASYLLDDGGFIAILEQEGFIIQPA